MIEHRTPNAQHPTPDKILSTLEVGRSMLDVNISSKPIDSPGHISLLLPTREKPGPLQNLFDSLETATGDKALLDIWVYVDDDDTATRALIDSGRSDRCGFAVHWVIAPATKSQGEMVNRLWQQCTTNAGIYIPVPDDYLFVTPQWDRIVRTAFDRCPDRLMLAYPDDPTCAPGQVTFPILSAEWINTVGTVLTEHFPFWFDDSWLDQIAQMVQRKFRLEIFMQPQNGKGKTPRMKNLLFWRNFFDYSTIEDRLAIADRLRRKIYGTRTAAYHKSLDAGKRLAQEFMAKAARRRREDILAMERQLSAPSSDRRPEKLIDYHIIENRAVNLLLEKAGRSMRLGRTAEALRALDNLQLSSRVPPGLETLRKACLEAAGGVPAAEKTGAAPREDPQSVLTGTGRNPEPPPSGTGIIVFGHTRPRDLKNVLESLRRQQSGLDIHVWLDGHSGRMPLIEKVEQCRALVKADFPEAKPTFINGHIGIEKLTLDGLAFMAQRYARVIVLEDDCFPTSTAIAAFEKALDEIEPDPQIYSVYGHHFSTRSETDTITRFQGWGWATTSGRLLSLLPQLRACFAMPEPEYVRWAAEQLTAEVRARLDVTPGRNCIDVMSRIFSWDSCTCLLTAMRGLRHKKTLQRVVYNCGMGEDSGHFQKSGVFRRPPYNMISPEEVWQYFDAAPDPTALNRRGERLFLAGDIDGATEAFARAAEIDPACAAARNNLGAAHWQCGRTGEAARCFSAALQISPGDRHAVVNYSSLLIETDQRAAAAKLLQGYLGNHPDDAEAARLLARLPQVPSPSDGLPCAEKPVASANRLMIPILVTGAHRSGTTLVGKILCASPELHYIDEPFNINHSACSCGARVDLWFKHISNGHAPLMHGHIRHLISEGEGRCLVKDPIALFSSEWLADTFQMQVVVMIRHPAAFAGSLKRLNWKFPFAHLLRQPELMESRLEAFAEEIEAYARIKHDVVDQAILLWRILYRTVETYRTRHPDWTFLRLEDLSRNPGEHIRALCARLGVRYAESVDRAVSELCSRAHPAEAAAGDPFCLKRNSAAAVWSWKSQLTADEIKRVREGCADVASLFYTEKDW